MSAQSIQRTMVDLFCTDDFDLDCEMPSRLDFVQSRIPRPHNYSLWGWAMNHTLFPYYASFLSYPQKVALMQSITQSSKGNRLHISQRYIHKQRLKCCPECMIEDDNVFGQPYWHVSHQPASIRVCLKHNSVLLDQCVSCGMGFTPRRDEFLECQIKCRCGHDLTVTCLTSKIDKIQKEKLTKLAQNTLNQMGRLQDILIWDIDGSSLAKEYCGLTPSWINDKSRRQKYIEHLMHFFGHDLWSMLLSNTKLPEYWLYRLYYWDKPMDPLFYYLMLFYSESMNVKSTKEVASTSQSEEVWGSLYARDV